jgi:hypothetical protein
MAMDAESHPNLGKVDIPAWGQYLSEEAHIDDFPRTARTTGPQNGYGPYNSYV